VSTVRQARAVLSRALGDAVRGGSCRATRSRSSPCRASCRLANARSPPMSWVSCSLSFRPAATPPCGAGHGTAVGGASRPALGGRRPGARRAAGGGSTRPARATPGAEAGERPLGRPARVRACGAARPPCRSGARTGPGGAGLTHPLRPRALQSLPAPGPGTPVVSDRDTRALAARPPRQLRHAAARVGGWTCGWFRRCSATPRSRRRPATTPTCARRSWPMRSAGWTPLSADRWADQARGQRPETALRPESHKAVPRHPRVVGSSPTRPTARSGTVHDGAVPVVLQAVSRAAAWQRAA